MRKLIAFLVVCLSFVQAQEVKVFFHGGQPSERTSSKSLAFEVLTGIATAHPDILKNPAPGVSLRDLSGEPTSFLGAAGMNYVLSFTIDDPSKQHKIRNEINQAIIRRFLLPPQEATTQLLAQGT